MSDAAHRPANRQCPEPEILLEDDRLVVVRKAAGLLVHRTTLDRHEQVTLLGLLAGRLRGPAHPVHRLDKPTSGPVILAYDTDAARRLGEAFASGGVDKRYVAIVRGHVPEGGEIDHPLRPLDDDPGDRPGTRSATAQPATTRFTRIAACELPHRVDRYPTSRYSLVALEPLTGRRHQLRRHLKHAGHPIVGDTTYGKGGHNRLFQSLFGVSRLYLACTALTFPHPGSGMPVRVRSALDADFSEVVRRLGWDEAARAADIDLHPPLLK